MDNQSKPQAIVDVKRNAERLLGEIHYDTTSLTHRLVKAHRAGMPAMSGVVILNQLRAAIDEAQNAFEYAIAQPENKVAVRPVVNL